MFDTGSFETKLDRDELLEVLGENRSKHRGMFEEAVTGYRERVIAELEEHIASIRDGKVSRVVVNLPAPKDHTKDYDRAIRMVEMHQDDTITLDSETFRMFVMDEWDWKAEFLQTNARYTE